MPNGRARLVASADKPAKGDPCKRYVAAEEEEEEEDDEARGAGGTKLLSAAKSVGGAGAVADGCGPTIGDTRADAAP